MARMLPPQRGVDVRSRAERWLFGFVRDDRGTAERVGLHSPGRARGRLCGLMRKVARGAYHAGTLRNLQGKVSAP